MKRLLKISFDYALLSFVPVISWFLLGIIVDANLINIFTLTYPLQFIYYILKSIFSSGANISKEKDGNPDATMSGITAGIIVAIVIYGTIAINVDSYISFMNMDTKIYRTFTLYSIGILFFQVLFSFVLTKLYYEDNNTLANQYSLHFNLLNFFVLIGASLITKNQAIIVVITLLVMSVFTILILVKSWNRFKYNLNIMNCIKYDSVELFNSVAFLVIFLFGLSNSFEFGNQYVIALTFSSLITDTQWDTFSSITTVAQIDISKNQFNYIKHRNNAYKLLLLLLLSTLLMFCTLYHFYDLDIRLALIYLSFDFINFILYPIYTIKTCYLQLEWSAIKTTSNKICSNTIRMFISFLSSPFCTGIGQLLSSFYQFITINFMFWKYFYICSNGNIRKK